MTIKNEKLHIFRCPICHSSKLHIVSSTIYRSAKCTHHQERNLPFFQLHIVHNFLFFQIAIIKVHLPNCTLPRVHPSLSRIQLQIVHCLGTISKFYIVKSTICHSSKLHIVKSNICHCVFHIRRMANCNVRFGRMA